MGDSATAMSIAQFKMNDYKAIKYQKKPYKRLRPEMLLAKHMESRRFIEKSLSRPFDGKTVLVTHHGIHPGSVHSRYDGDTINSSYVSDMRDVLVEFSPDLCVHGHVHSSFDYGFHNTRIVVNPKGYFDENPEYVRDLIIDLDHLTSDHDPKV